MAETLPPLSTSELLTALDNPHFSSYIFMGAKSEKGWLVARAAHELLPALRIYRVTPSAEASVLCLVKTSSANS